MKDCFDGKISSDCLSRDLNGSSKRISNSSFEIHIERIKLDSEFEVKRTHIEKILTETINGNLTFDNLRSIASQLMFSNYFTWNINSEMGNRIGTIILELDNPEIHFSISNENLKLWKTYLASGIHQLKLNNDNGKGTSSN